MGDAILLGAAIAYLAVAVFAMASIVCGWDLVPGWRGNAAGLASFLVYLPIMALAVVFFLASVLLYNLLPERN